MIKIIDTIDHQLLLDQYQILEPNMQWADGLHKGRQTSLQYRQDSDIWLGATGKNNDAGQRYDKLNPYFQNSIFEIIIKKYQLFRTRLMWLGGNACYSFHCDRFPRIHIPIITNPHSCIIFLEGPIEFLQIGNVYWIDTTKAHTAMNGADTPRLHLVGEVTQ